MSAVLIGAYETALAHVIANKAEAAYRRGDALEKRRAMMEAWAQWCEPKAANVLAFAKPGGVAESFGTATA